MRTTSFHFFSSSSSFLWCLCSKKENPSEMEKDAKTILLLFLSLCSRMVKHHPISSVIPNSMLKFTQLSFKNLRMCVLIKRKMRHWRIEIFVNLFLVYTKNLWSSFYTSSRCETSTICSSISSVICHCLLRCSLRSFHIQWYSNEGKEERREEKFNPIIFSHYHHLFN